MRISNGVFYVCVRILLTIKSQNASLSTNLSFVDSLWKLYDNIYYHITHYRYTLNFPLFWKSGDRFQIRFYGFIKLKYIKLVLKVFWPSVSHIWAPVLRICLRAIAKYQSRSKLWLKKTIKFWFYKYSIPISWKTIL